jgi:hypothetical protein
MIDVKNRRKRREEKVIIVERMLEENGLKVQGIQDIPYITVKRKDR